MPDLSEGACNGYETELWFAWPIERGERNTDRPDKALAMRMHRDALAICADCPLALTCAQYAMANEERGLWGITEAERWHLGGHGRPARREDRRSQTGALDATLAIMDRFGPDHPVTRWASARASRIGRGRNAA